MDVEIDERNPPKVDEKDVFEWRDKLGGLGFKPMSKEKKEYYRERFFDNQEWDEMYSASLKCPLRSSIEATT